MLGTRLQSGCLLVGLNLMFLLLGGLGLYYANDSWQLSNNGGKVTGKVIALDESSGEDGTTYSPIVEYVVNDRTYQHNGENSSNPPAYHVGQTVEIVYDRANPEKARINNWWELWLLPLILCPVTLCVAVPINLMLGVRMMRGR